jgi:hypothetical protein
MSAYTKQNHKLPVAVSFIFIDISENRELRDNYISVLRETGWTLQSIAIACGLTRERVRQLSARKSNPAVVKTLISLGAVIPNPPKKEDKSPVKKPEIDPETLKKLLELQPLAQKVRSNSKNYREEAETYTALLYDAYKNQGISLYRLAKLLGITHGAIRFRLARYGYIQPGTGESRVYTPVKAENRVKISNG